MKYFSFHRSAMVAVVAGTLLSIIADYNFHRLTNNSYWPLGPVSKYDLLLDVIPCFPLLIAVLLSRNLLLKIITSLAIIIYIILSFNQLAVINPQHGSEDLLGIFFFQTTVGIVSLFANLMIITSVFIYNKLSKLIKN